MFGIKLGSSSRPTGSPLSPQRAPAPARPVAAPLAPMAPPGPMIAPGVAQRPLGAPTAPMLPTPPASVTRKKLSPWDKEHISGTLAEISRGFAGSKDFFGGLSGAASNVADRATAITKAAKGITSVGGPDDSFEITENADGTRSYKPIAEVQSYVSGKEKAKLAPKPGETATFVGDTMYSINQLPEPQRPGAYRIMKAQAQALGHDVSTLPDDYSGTFADAMINRTVGARQGSANAATSAYRAQVNDDRDAMRGITDRNSRSVIANRGATQARAGRAEGRAIESHSRAMRKAPPGTRKGANNDLSYIK